jgi:hypothetical protein
MFAALVQDFGTLIFAYQAMLGLEDLVEGLGIKCEFTFDFLFLAHKDFIFCLSSLAYLFNLFLVCDTFGPIALESHPREMLPHGPLALKFNFTYLAFFLQFGADWIFGIVLLHISASVGTVEL